MIKRYRKNLVATALTPFVLLFALLSPATHAERFFRYVDENGKLVLSHTITNDRVKYGYEIVDEYARVIQLIAPQLSEAQYQEKLAQDVAHKECLQAIYRVQNLFQSQREIDYAEEQALGSIDTQISNTKANLSQLRTQRQALETQAAQMDLSGKEISNVLLDKIESAIAQERNLEEQIEKRYAYKLSVRYDYEFERKVFELTDCEKGLPKRKVLQASR